MSPLIPYYRRQLLVAAALGLVAGVLLGSWPTGLVVAAAHLAGAFWAPRSGRFVVDPSRGAAALREDERARANRARASEVALQVMIAAGFLLWLVVRASGQVAVSHGWLAGLVVLGVISQIAAEWHLDRRREHGVGRPARPASRTTSP